MQGSSERVYGQWVVRIVDLLREVRGLLVLRAAYGQYVVRIAWSPSEAAEIARS